MGIGQSIEQMPIKMAETQKTMQIEMQVTAQ
jgi:hypothetical protein